MAMLEPKKLYLDETDSGLISMHLVLLPMLTNLKVIKTHHSYYALPKFIDYIVPDFVHVFYDGKL
jgi:Fe-S cluster assembly ATPase SufC